MKAPAGPRRFHRAPLSAREALLFEAGIKLGGLFHQYLGIPVSAPSAAALARAIESAISLQPYVRRVRVRIDPSRGGPLGHGRFAYRYLTAEMLRATVVLVDGRTEVTATLEPRPDLRYPLMSVKRVRGPPAPPRAGVRSGRTRGRSGRRRPPSAG